MASTGHALSHSHTGYTVLLNNDAAALSLGVGAGGARLSTGGRIAGRHMLLQSQLKGRPTTLSGFRSVPREILVNEPRAAREQEWQPMHRSILEPLEFSLGLQSQQVFMGLIGNRKSKIAIPFLSAVLYTRAPCSRTCRWIYFLPAGSRHPNGTWVNSPFQLATTIPVRRSSCVNRIPAQKQAEAESWIGG